MAFLISTDDLRQAFTDWHKPTKLVNSPTSKLNEVVGQVNKLPNRYPQAIAEVIHSLLLNALDEMRRRHWIHSENYLDVVRIKPLIVLHYVEQQPVSKTCIELSISQATYYRYLTVEFEALASFLSAIEEERLPNDTSRTTLQRHLITQTPLLPSDYLPRSALIDKAVENLTADVRPRALALLGLPGAGKTTLAVAIANLPAIRQRFPDGVLWMELGLGNPVERCLSESLAALNVDSQIDTTTSSRESLSRSLRDVLANKRMLIVFDDVWEMSTAESLMVGGDQSWHLITTRFPALAYALTAKNVIDTSDFSVAETRQLLDSYLQDSQLIHGNYSIPALSEDALERMNRLPLNIVLIGKHLRYLANTQQQQRLTDAIQQINTLTLPQILNDLDSRIETSVDALPAEAKNTAVYLSIFPPKPNSFSHDDAVAVAECTRKELDELIDMGLIEVWRGRLSMHSSIHHYFAERYASYRQLASKRMVKHFLIQLQTHGAQFGLEDSVNIAMAIQHAAIHADVDSEAQLIRHAAWLFEQSGELNQLAQWIQHTQSRRPSERDSLALSTEAARLIWLQGDANQAVEQLELCMKEARRLGLDEIYALCEHTLSYIRVEQDQEDAGIASAHKAYDSAPAARYILDKSEIAAVRQMVMRMRLDSLRNMMARVVVKLAGKQTQRADIVLANSVVAWLDYLSGDIATVEKRLRVALTSQHAQTHPLIAAITNGALARLCCLEGRYAEAQGFVQQFDEPAVREASPEFTALSYEVRGSIDTAMNNMDSAQRWLEEGLVYTRTHNNPLLRAVLLSSLCELHLRLGKFDSAQTLAEQAMQIASVATDPIMRCDTTVAAASAVSAVERMDEADQLFLRAKDIGALGTTKANPWAVMHWYVHHAQHALRKQLLNDADADLQHVIDFAQQLRARAHEGHAWFERGRIALRKGNRDDASSFGRRGQEMLTEIGHADAIEVRKWLYENQLTGQAK